MNCFLVEKNIFFSKDPCFWWMNLFFRIRKTYRQVFRTCSHIFYLISFRIDIGNWLWRIVFNFFPIFGILEWKSTWFCGSGKPSHWWCYKKDQWKCLITIQVHSISRLQILVLFLQLLVSLFRSQSFISKNLFFWSENADFIFIFVDGPCFFDSGRQQRWRRTRNRMWCSGNSNHF